MLKRSMNEIKSYEEQFFKETTIDDFSERVQDIIWMQIKEYNNTHVPHYFENISTATTPNLMKLLEKLVKFVSIYGEKQITEFYYITKTPHFYSIFLQLGNYSGDNEYVIYAKELSVAHLGCEGKDLVINECLGILEGYISYCVEMFLDLHSFLQFGDGMEEIQVLFYDQIKAFEHEIPLFTTRAQELLVTLLSSILVKPTKDEHNPDYYLPVFLQVLELAAIVQANKRSFDQTVIFGLEA
jgi:hypothetical protein